MDELQSVLWLLWHIEYNQSQLSSPNCYLTLILKDQKLS
ncbi:hypothetical protein AM1_1664 [Acaryochloris marina MBIC11017]|uniref:Uncharacterized protein n=1 Tax=Acaryochloris marina (strain MBIC 11017) TaxID=329726 RepID=B0CB46_ACAM1|nr:hypothetical protein AM1_1664 [Acaryochloris marina MBIC11017]